MTVSVELQRHPASPCDALERIGVEVVRAANGVRLIYRLVGEIDALRIPPPQVAARRDELWRHTCAELFVTVPGQDAYVEFNFSPSGEWAAYQFDTYRQGMRPAECDTPAIKVWHDGHELHATVQCVLPASLVAAASLQVGLSLVVEDATGHCSYWALHHPGDRPDFHHRDSFTLTL